MVEQALKDFEEAMRPADEIDVVQQLMKLSVLLRKPKDFEDNMEEMFDLMASFFQQYPFDIFRDACKAHVEKSPFFPSVADLMPFLKNTFARRKMAYDKLVQLQRVHHNPAPQGQITHGWRLEIMRGRPSRNREDTSEYRPEKGSLRRKSRQQNHN